MQSFRVFLGVFVVLAAGWGFSPSRAEAGPLVRGEAEAHGLCSDRLERLDAVFRQYVEDALLPGAVVLVARDGVIVHEGAYGYLDRESGEAMRTDAIFRIASQTKALVSVGILMLQEEGKLLLHDPVGKYLPAFARTTVAEAHPTAGYVVVPARRPITLHDLLTHTAGIGYGGGLAREAWEAAGITGWYFADRDEPIAETIDRLAALPQEAHPGERYVYGYGTDILGVVIEAVSGLSLEAFLQRRILEPLGMDDTHFYLPPEKRARLATVYSRIGSGPLARAPDEGTRASQGHYVEGPRKSFSGGAGLLSTGRDYATFLQMLLNGGEFAGERYLSPKSVALMTTNHLKGEAAFQWDPGTGFGLGFRVLEDLGARGKPGTVGEYGWGGAYHSTYWVDPVEGLVVVYFTQVIPADRIDDHDKLRALVYQAVVESRAE
jgi:CubicO group peptidase (beta-lactamase class C family)